MTTGASRRLPTQRPWPAGRLDVYAIIRLLPRNLVLAKKANTTLKPRP